MRVKRLLERIPPELSIIAHAVTPTGGEATLGYIVFRNTVALLLKQNKTNPPNQRYIKQLLFIVPKHQWLYSAFPLFVRTLEITTP